MTYAEIPVPSTAEAALATSAQVRQASGRRRTTARRISPSATVTTSSPRFAPDATAAFESRVPWLRGRRAWELGIGGGAVLTAVFLTDYFQGKAVYAALASYHAYLEFPVLLALLLAPAMLRSSRPSVRVP